MLGNPYSFLLAEFVYQKGHALTMSSFPWRETMKLQSSHYGWHILALQYCLKLINKDNQVTRILVSRLIGFAEGLLLISPQTHGRVEWYSILFLLHWKIQDSGSYTGVQINLYPLTLKTVKRLVPRLSLVLLCGITNGDTQLCMKIA